MKKQMSEQMRSLIPHLWCGNSVLTLLLGLFLVTVTSIYCLPCYLIWTMNVWVVESFLFVMNLPAQILKRLRFKKLFKVSISLSKKLATKSCMNGDPYFIIDVFNNYKLGVDYRNQYLTIERG